MNRIFKKLGIIVALSALITTNSGSILISASTTSPTATKQVLGFTVYNYVNDTSSLNSMTANKKSLDEIATATHTTDGSGNLSGMVAVNQITYANSVYIKPLLMVNNNFSASIGSALLENPSSCQNLINNIKTCLKTNNFKGVNIDFEGLLGKDRTYLNSFMQNLYATLHPLNYTISISVMAKSSDSPWLNYAYDYATLGNYTDEFMIMTYDEHYIGGTPGPVASIGWVNDIVNYAVSVVPKSKILIGLAAYGYDWCSDGTATSYSISKCYSVAANYHAQIIWDDQSKTSHFSYTDSKGLTHQVWFEDANSISYKCDLVNQSNILGTGIWRLGLENSNFWTVINSKFNR